MNKRIFVGKKEKFNIASKNIEKDFRDNLNLENIHVEKYEIYDIFEITEEEYEKAEKFIFADHTTDIIYEDLNLDNKKYLAIQNLKNQFSMRSASAEQCLKVINPNSQTKVVSGELLVFENIDEQDLLKIEKYYINKVEKEKKDLSIMDKAEENITRKEEIITNFSTLNNQELTLLKEELSLALSVENLTLIQSEYQKRDPYVGELKIFDTYWSDHCRHSTFNTILENINIEDEEQAEIFQKYLKLRESLNNRNPITLMDMATIYAKYAKKTGILTNLEDTEENNAISIEVAENNETFLLQFKNETHNHPTEIEPYGGASTCIGGAIRDPLSGRAFVYQGMRIAGSGNIFEDISKTKQGKLPQRVISKISAKGFSDYGNQIGLATTYTKELYHPDYVAKHLEAGAVIGVVNKKQVIRENPVVGDVILLIGGKTGLEGIGGASGSSKTHSENSIVDAAVEVQKGNALEERAIQKLFKKAEVSKLIKKCNDFGAGGISVAITELADSIEIDLNAIKLKVKGLLGSEIALSESQERMAVLISQKDVEEFIQYCEIGSVDATVVAKVTDNHKYSMKYNGEIICDINSDFLHSNGVKEYQDVIIKDTSKTNENGNTKIFEDKTLLEWLDDPNVVDNKNQDYLFDGTVGATTVLMPYGGKYRLTKADISAQKIPETEALVSIMGYGFDPMINDPFQNSYLAVKHSIAKLVAAGGKLKDINLSFQEYFMRLEKDPQKWGVVVSSMLGALKAQAEFKCPALGGKDSMSGTFENIDVPPTLISFAFSHMPINEVISNVINTTAGHIYLTTIQEFEKIANKNIESAMAIGRGGVATTLFKMLMGNKIGAVVSNVESTYGDIIFVSEEQLDYRLIGTTNKTQELIINGENNYLLDDLITKYENYYEKVYPNITVQEKELKFETNDNSKPQKLTPTPKEKPQVLIPIFPGTNSEIEMNKAFTRAGAECREFIFTKNISESVEKFALEISKCDIIALSGGFSGGDEPDGSGKFIVCVLNNLAVKKAIEKHLEEDKLIIGICNGFQALIKSGLLPYGKVQTVPNSPTLFRNSCDHHLSAIVNTKVQSKKNNSPWLLEVEDQVYTQVISHGEGRIVIDDKLANELNANGQIAFVYCNENGEVTNESNFNGSDYAIEGLLSPCKKILGKMAHSERYEAGLYQNIIGNHEIKLFESAVKYFKNGGIYEQ